MTVTRGSGRRPCGPQPLWMMSSTVCLRGGGLGTGRVVAVGERLRAGRLDDQRRLARVQPPHGRLGLADSTRRSQPRLPLGRSRSGRRTPRATFSIRAEPRLLDEVDLDVSGGRLWKARPSPMARTVGKP